MNNTEQLEIDLNDLDYDRDYDLEYQIGYADHFYHQHKDDPDFYKQQEEEKC